MKRLRLVRPEEVVHTRREAVDAETLQTAAGIVQDVRQRGEMALREYAERFGDVPPGGALTVPLDGRIERLPLEQQETLRRTADRIRYFAEAQKAALTEVTVAVPGGRAGHTIAPLHRAGCYAPGGRFPLPSSVLMTAITARTAGVQQVWVASPRPADATLAAAAIAGADGFLAVGGAHAIAALAYGAGPIPCCDAIVGPGNRWVTAAKQLVAGTVAIDMLAGPSELVVLADGSAPPAVVAADLLAQAEHDPDALPVFITADRALLEAVDAEVDRQLALLPTRDTAEPAVQHGFAVLVSSLEQGVEVCNAIGPEHLQLLTERPHELKDGLSHYGGLFLGTRSAEVFGDYGAGPNHVLPTGGTSRFTGGLSVFTFLRIRTWLELDDPTLCAPDAVRLARMEGLEGHARAAEARLADRPPSSLQ